MTKRNHRAELDALVSELARPAANGRHDADTAIPQGERGDHARELEKLIHELQGKLSDAADDAEGIVRAHPLAAVASALLLGIVIGRLTGRR